jgi:aspartate/methionine/tyrosine aminotransferase
MAAEHDAINLAGFPNFPVDTVLTDIVIRLAKNNVHQYLPMAGYPPLLSNIALLVKILPKNSFARNRNTSNCRGYTSHIYNYSSFGKS